MVAFYSHAWKIFIMPGFFSCHPSQSWYYMNLGLFLKSDYLGVQLMSHEYLHVIQQSVFSLLLWQQQSLYHLTPIECTELGFVVVVVVLQSPSRVWLFVTPWTAARQASLSLTISQSFPKLMFIALVMPSSHLILWHPLLLLPAIIPIVRDFSNESSAVPHSKCIACSLPFRLEQEAHKVSIYWWFWLRCSSARAALIQHWVQGPLRGGPQPQAFWGSWVYFL